MKRFAFLPVIVLALAAACQDAPTAPMAVQTPIAPRLAAAATTMTNFSYRVNVTYWIPCTAEDVTFTGDVHYVFHTTFNANNYSVSWHHNAQGVTGTGSVTGDTYRAVGAAGFGIPGEGGSLMHQSGKMVNGWAVFEGVNNYRYIGQRTGNNFQLHDNFHGTIDSNGVVTITHDNFTYECS